MTAVYVPEGIAPPALVGALGSRGEFCSLIWTRVDFGLTPLCADIIIAGGLHKDIKAKVSFTLSGTEALR